MLISPEEAYQIVMKKVKPLTSERRELNKSLGFVLAETVKADQDMPPRDRSAMDGYAINLVSSSKNTFQLKVIGECPAGSSTKQQVKHGEAMRIYTGANIPPGANSVVMVEQTTEDDDIVTIKGRVIKGQHIFQRGENAIKGSILLDRGVIVDSQHIGVCAAVGKSSIRVFKKPSILIICTGAELKELTEKTNNFETHNSNGPMLCAALESACFNARYITLPDHLPRITKKLDRAVHDFNVIALVGGVSKGKYDYVREAILNLGGKIHFHGIAMKPGKPQLFATIRQNNILFGLPGNPLSAMTGFHELVLPAIKRLSGLNIDRCQSTVHAKLSKAIDNKGDRVRFYLGRLFEVDSQLWVDPLSSKSSADIAASGSANGTLIIQTNIKRIEKGETVVFRPWNTSLF